VAIWRPQPTSGWPAFIAWALYGALWTFSVLSFAGLYTLPLAVVLTWLLLRYSTDKRDAVGLIAGAAAIRSGIPFVDIEASARKHGVPEEDMLHALRHHWRAFETDDPAVTILAQPSRWRWVLSPTKRGRRSPRHEGPQEVLGGVVDRMSKSWAAPARRVRRPWAVSSRAALLGRRDRRALLSRAG